MVLAYFGYVALAWILLIPLALFGVLVFNAAMAAGLDTLATWTGSPLLRRLAVGFDVFGHVLTLLLAVSVVAGSCWIGLAWFH